MKTKHIVMGLGALVALGLVYKFIYKKDTDDEKKSNIVTCRAGTCPTTRTDGSTWCTSAACKKSANISLTSVPITQTS